MYVVIKTIKLFLFCNYYQISDFYISFDQLVFAHAKFRVLCDIIII